MEPVSIPAMTAGIIRTAPKSRGDDATAIEDGDQRDDQQGGVGRVPEHPRDPQAADPVVGERLSQGGDRGAEGLPDPGHPLIVASPAGFEPATFRLEGGCSIH